MAPQSENNLEYELTSRLGAKAREPSDHNSLVSDIVKLQPVHSGTAFLTIVKAPLEIAA